MSCDHLYNCPRCRAVVEELEDKLKELTPKKGMIVDEKIQAMARLWIQMDGNWHEFVMISNFITDKIIALRDYGETE